MVKSGFFGGYSCDWCDAKFNSKKTAGDHELDCDSSPSNLQKKAREYTSNWISVSAVDGLESAAKKEQNRNYEEAIELYTIYGNQEDVNRVTRLLAHDKEEYLEYDEAISLYQGIGDKNAAKRVRKLKAEQGAVKVDQTVVQGDQITKTEIKDSVLNRSNVGGGSSKMQELRELKEMLSEGLIDDDEFKQMKKEILGK